MSYSADAMAHISMYNTKSSCQRTFFSVQQYNKALIVIVGL